jgi:hypothetical protein
MKVKTSELIGPALDWAVATIEGWNQFDEDGVPIIQLDSSHMRARWGLYSPSTDWGIGGMIIEREDINLRSHLGNDKDKVAFLWRNHQPAFRMRGPTPLVAAMRCFCCAELGDEVEIPEELK